MAEDTGTQPDVSHLSHVPAGDDPSGHGPTESAADPQEQVVPCDDSVTQSCIAQQTDRTGSGGDVDTEAKRACHGNEEEEEEEFLSASEGEKEDDDSGDDDQKLEEWAMSLSDDGSSGGDTAQSARMTSTDGEEAQLSSEKSKVGTQVQDTSSSTSTTPSAENLDTQTKVPSSPSCGASTQEDKSEGTSSESEVVENSAFDKDSKISRKDEEELEASIAAATCDTREEEESGGEADGASKPEAGKEAGESEDKEGEESREREEERQRQEEEDALTEEELQRRLSEAVKVKTKGNDTFKSGEYREALELYTQALQLCPLKYIHQRALMLSNRAACRIKQGFYETAVKDCTKSIELDPAYIKAYFRRADAYEKLEKLDEALKDHQKVVELDRSQAGSYHACLRLEKEIQERNEKMKAEMLGKLKDLGNLVLRPFGLSTNNFQLQQDPNTGSYSVQFLQTPPSNGH